jgi:hypothetical protein
MFFRKKLAEDNKQTIQRIQDLERKVKEANQQTEEGPNVFSVLKKDGLATMTEIDAKRR